MSERFLLAEPIFRSIQCEGKTIGKDSIFIRFFGCQYRCEWCDSKFTYDSDLKSIPVSLKDIYEKVVFEYSKTKNLIITGGEPLLYQQKIIELIKIFPGHSFEIETNGALEMSKDFLFALAAIPNKQERILLNISPKFQYFEKDEKVIIDNIKALDVLGIPYILKFVYEQKYEKDIILFQKDKKHLKYVMPECQTREEHLETFQPTLDFCMKYGCNFSPRLHILLWDNKKGV